MSEPTPRSNESPFAVGRYVGTPDGRAKIVAHQPWETSGWPRRRYTSIVVELVDSGSRRTYATNDLRPEP